MCNPRYAFSLPHGEYVVRYPGLRHGDGQQDSDTTPVWLTCTEREVIEAGEWPNLLDEIGEEGQVITHRYALVCLHSGLIYWIGRASHPIQAAHIATWHESGPTIWRHVYARDANDQGGFAVYSAFWPVEQDADVTVDTLKDRDPMTYLVRDYDVSPEQLASITPINHEG